MLPNALQQATQLYEAGRFEDAAQLCRALLAREPDEPEINHLLGLICYRQGDTEAALELLKRAAASGRATARMYSNLGAVLKLVGKPEAAITAYQKALALEPGNPWALNNLGVIYRDNRQRDAAIEAFKRAIALKPDFADALTNLRLIYADLVPQWHFAMMNDAARNDAYEAAIRRNVAGKRVLDIGTGAGLLALMAARAGAKSVVSCEAVGVIARQAHDIVAQNGLADIIRVIPKRSTDLTLGADLPERAEVLITETFSSNVIDEGILATMEHAHRHLLVPGATIIPAAASAIGFLVGGEALRQMLFVERIKGFDLASFNQFASPRLVVPLDGVPHDVLSDDVELLRFDLTNQNFPMGGRELSLVATRGGPCVGIAQWIQLDLDGQTHYRNRPIPGGHNTHWPNIVYRFPKPLMLEPGDRVRIIARHDRAEIALDLIDKSAGPGS
jgi:predicted nicotinamide N-methyase